MLGGGRRWQGKVRGDGLGKRYTKTILTITYLPLPFCFIRSVMGEATRSYVKISTKIKER